MKIKLFLFLLITFSFTQTAFSMPNPWVECGDDLYCAQKLTGFNLPLRVNNFDIRATKNIIEFSFYLDIFKKISIRKIQNTPENMDENRYFDISGVYDKFPYNNLLTLKNGIIFSVRGEKNKFYVANFSAETGYYSIYCKKGLKKRDIEKIYKLLEEAEAPQYSEFEPLSIEDLMKKRTIDDIVEPIYTQDCFPRTLQKKGVTSNCFERANLGDETQCSKSEIKMIKEYYKKGQEKDILNNGSGQFCAY